MSGNHRVPRTRCSGQWTEARFQSFIKSALRSATMRWAPIQQCRKNAWISRGLYKCDLCGAEVPATTKNQKGERKSSVFVDHIVPIIDPAVGFVSWDETIERMFSELSNLQCICGKCHENKTNKEKDIAVKRRQKEKQIG